MNTFIALIRAVNVGGHNRLPMAGLRNLLKELGFLNVSTYIQSGNVVFQTDQNDKLKLEKDIHNGIKAKFGLELIVFVKRKSDLQNIVYNCPFSEKKKINTYFAILSEQPNENLVEFASGITYQNEVYHILNDCIYVYCPNGYGRSKFNLKNFESKLRVSATARNYKTML